MFRADHSTKSVDLFGSGKHGYTKGDPGVVAATVVTANHLNAFQEESARAIEAVGATLSKTNMAQLALAIEGMRQASALENFSALSGGITGAVGVGCVSFPAARNRADTFDVTSTAAFRCWAAVKTNSFVANGASIGSVTAALTAVALRISSTPQTIAVAVGSDGKYVSSGGGSSAITIATTATISGSPNLQRIIWDDINSLWWACGPGGLYKSASAGTGAMTWTQVTATSTQYVVALPSGRVVTYRAAATQLFYTDNLTSMTAGAVIAGGTGEGLAWDKASGRLCGTRFYSEDSGATAVVGTIQTYAAVAFSFRGRVWLVLHDGGGNENIRFATYTGQAPSVTPADWCVIGDALHESSFGTCSQIAGSGNQVVLAYGGNGTYSSSVLADLFGALG